MSTVYTGVDVEESGTDYDNALDAPALYELAVSENPNYASLSSKSVGANYPPPRGFVDAEYDQATTEPPAVQPIYKDGTVEDDGYLQTS